MSWLILSVTIKYEQDLVAIRQRTRQIAGLLGFEPVDQTRIATAVSEIARNAFNYAAGGKVEFWIEGQTAPQLLLIQVKDQGPGIANLPAILQGQYHSKTGMGLGLVGARRLVDQFEIDSAPGQGTTVCLKRLLPKKAPIVTSSRIRWLVDQLALQWPQDPLEEIRQQNQELLNTLEELRQRQEELAHLNHELEDTNRGVMALYAELDEKADHLRRADEMKSRFLSNMSHEFRTPLNSILGLTRLLLDFTDGPLASEQEKQVYFIRKSAEDLLELVNDLLDLAKIEAGKIVIQPVEFELPNLFSALRGMLRPLLLNSSLNLIFEEPVGLPALYTDEGKVSQILRNFISNALKFTEQGEIRVSAELGDTGDTVIFSVADTGIGIAPEDQPRIFEEFTQLEHPLQKRVKGTGLGLPLCRKLATLLGGSVSVQSELGVGSTFWLEIPIRYEESPIPVGATPEAWSPDPGRLPVLIVEDEIQTQFLYEKYLKDSRFQPIPVRSIRQAQQMMGQIQPAVILLDIILIGEDSWGWLAKLKNDETTRHIPVLMVTKVEDQHKGLALGADAYCLKPIERHELLAQLNRLTSQEPKPNLLIIDDEERFRYLLKKLLAETPYFIHEAANGAEGLYRACQEQPQLIFLDLNMPGMNGFELLAELKTNPITQIIPVVILTSKVLTEEEQQRLEALAQGILSKETLSSSEIILNTVEKILMIEGSV
jgi:signal transduction histidine kinase/DNA-binding response OmpR family regulator